MVDNNNDDVRDIAIRNEVRIDSLEDTITDLKVEVRDTREELKEDIKNIRDDIYSIKTNELKHYKNGGSFWLKFFGAGAGGAIFIEIIRRLPDILNAVKGFVGL